MTAKLAGLLDGDEPDVVIDTGDFLYTKSDIRTAGKILADHVSNSPGRARLLVIATADAAMLVSGALAAEYLGCAALLLDPGHEPGENGVVLTDRPRDGFSELRTGRFTWYTRTWPQPGRADELPPASLLFHTSGSTGKPSAVVKPLARVLDDSRRIAAVLHGTSGAPVVSAVPAFHSYGFTYGPLAGLIAGVPTIVRSPMTRPAALSRTITDAKARTLVGLPLQYRLIADSGANGFAALAQAVSAGAPLPADAIRRILADHSFRLYNVYGTSETGTITICDVREAGDPSVIGHPLPGIRAEIDEHSRELLLCTDALANGYFGETGLRPLPLAGGFYRSGDLAERVGGGIRITGRTGDVINIAGRKTSRRRIEEVLQTHPRVSEAQVVVEADDVRGDLPVARIVPRGDVTVTELTRWSREHLAPFEVPRRIELWRALPRSATGKLLYRDNERQPTVTGRAPSRPNVPATPEHRRGETVT